MAAIICPNCGRSIPSGSPFCPECGFKLTDNSTAIPSRRTRDHTSLPRRKGRSSNHWQYRLIPNLTHLRQVGQFVLNNGWFILLFYVISLLFNAWRWWFFGLFILTTYLYPLLTGRNTFLERKPTEPKNGRDDQQFSEVTPSAAKETEADQEAPQPQFRKPAKKGSHHLVSNREFQTGSILIIPSLICYLVTRRIIRGQGIQLDQIFNQTHLGRTVDVYFIALGVLGIATAMVIGGLIKAVTHHAFGGQKIKRWGIITAVLTVLLAVVMYQDAVTATSAGAVVSAIGAFLMPFLPWLAAIFYGMGIIKNILTPQRRP
ncbi:hypothetical protein IWT140_00279 [Secundilactobacillus pentosiphilus]|uniref:Zinc-ribbon domain-containing protein n=1 Tax=Secundilactobacillus pentosiphilus TaxID=1714682 RepID=A0A1Z5IM88_9LACO|nr:zinc ribbon domain-containing protein [Secundilactobacillus pentosiphilus]GAX02682.1 hypothetical protein IWT140_00279 [Secundilactobacillus pentosiphilus]